MVKACEDTQLVLYSTLEPKYKNFTMHDCFQLSSMLANKLNVDIKKPCTCQRQREKNATTSREQSMVEQEVEDYFRINVTVTLLGDLIERMIERFDSGQNIAVKGIMLIPAYIITNSARKTSITPFPSFYLPSPLTLNAKLGIWSRDLFWEEEFKKLKEQHLKATGQTVLTS